MSKRIGLTLKSKPTEVKKIPEGFDAPDSKPTEGAKKEKK